VIATTSNFPIFDIELLCITDFANDLFTKLHNLKSLGQEIREGQGGGVAITN
jgi:hypothetical protein